MKTPAKLGLLASLYLSQGLPFGFFTLALPVLMRAQGASLANIGLANLLALPWALKMLWAPFVDRYGAVAFGRRRSWIVPLQIASALTAAALALAGPGSGLSVIMVAVFVTNLLAATQDIATDGLAVDLLAEGERGYGNTVQVGGYRVGMIAGGGALLIVFDRLGWSPAFACMAALLMLATVPIALYCEAPAAPASAAASAFRAAEPLPAPDVAKPGFSAWLEFLRRPNMAIWVLVLASYKGGESLAYGMVKPMLVDRGMSVADIGMLIGNVGFVAGLLGAVLGGAVVTRFGRRRALLGCGVLQVLGVVVCIGPAYGFGGKAAFAVMSAVEHLTGGMATVALFTMMMDACGKEGAATDYTVQASVVVVATGIAAVLSGVSASVLGYPAHFVLSAAISAGAVLLAAWAFATDRIPPSPISRA